MRASSGRFGARKFADLKKNQAGLDYASSPAFELEARPGFEPGWEGLAGPFALPLRHRAEAETNGTMLKGKLAIGG